MAVHDNPDDVRSDMVRSIFSYEFPLRKGGTAIEQFVAVADYGDLSSTLLDLVEWRERSPKKRFVIRVTVDASIVSLPYRRFIMKAFVFGHFCDCLQSILDEYRLLLRCPGCVYHVRMSLPLRPRLFAADVRMEVWIDALALLAETGGVTAEMSDRQ